MPDSAEFAHSPHTKQARLDALNVVNEFQGLIEEHGRLSDDYAALLAQFPDPIPDPLPAVPVQGKDGTLRFVAVKVTEGGLRPLPDPEQALYAEAEARRCSLLAVHQPFVRVYWRPDDAGAAHKAANEWRARFNIVMKRLRRLYRLLDRKAQLAPDQEAQLHDFPLLRAAAASCGLSGEDILEAIRTHIEHLADDQANLEPKAGSHSAPIPPAPAASSDSSTQGESLIAQLRAWCEELKKVQKKMQKVVASDLGISPSYLSHILTSGKIPPKMEARIRRLISNSAAQG